MLPLENARDSLRDLLPRQEDWQSITRIGAELYDPKEDLPPKSILASVFAATLELTRDGDVDVRQDEQFGALYLKSIRRMKLVGEHPGGP